MAHSCEKMEMAPFDLQPTRILFGVIFNFHSLTYKTASCDKTVLKSHEANETYEYKNILLPCRDFAYNLIL